MNSLCTMSCLLFLCIVLNITELYLNLGKTDINIINEKINRKNLMDLKTEFFFKKYEQTGLFVQFL